MKKIFLVFLITIHLPVIAFSQELRYISGVITDPDTNTPLPGVNIMVKGTTTGTISNLDGYYQIKAPLGATLIYSFVGMQTKEVTVTEDNSVAYISVKDSLENIRNTEHVENESLDTDKNSDTNFIRLDETIPDDDSKTHSPYFYVKSKNKNSRMPLKATETEVNIAGIIADVSVKQIYVNNSSDVLEAVYVFPMSTKAAVYAMNMTIGRRKLFAKIEEKHKARQEYENAIIAGKTASLLEQHRPNVFQMNVGNILPGDSITVELKYTERVELKDDVYELVYPTVVGTRYSLKNEAWNSNIENQNKSGAGHTFDIVTNINAGVPIQNISCSSHNLNVEMKNKQNATLKLEKSEEFTGNRDYIIRYSLRGNGLESGILLHEDKDENFFLLMFQPPELPTEKDIPPREYIFIIDISGSMIGYPLDVSKKLLRNLISNLRPIDKFNVLFFSGGSKLWKHNSVAATKKNIDKAVKFIDRQRGGGGTDIFSAVKRAMKLNGTENYSRTFIIATDGYVNIEKELFSYIKINRNKANVFAFGIGHSPNRYLIEGIAHAGMGESFVVSHQNEAKDVSQKFQEYIETPVLTNININYNDFDAYDTEPVSIPDVFAKRPIIVYGKYKGKAKGTISLSGLSGGVNYSKTINITDTKNKNNNALRYLWARNKIKYLDDYSQFYEGKYTHFKNEDTHKNEIIELGLKYNLLTQYTSFVAIDTIIRTPHNQQTETKEICPDFDMNAGYEQTVASNQENNPAPGNSTMKSLSLNSSNVACEDVVVTAYGIRREKKALGYTVQEINSETIYGTNQNLSGLSGIVSGVSVTQNTGEPGSSSFVKIRGNKSIVSDNSPLIIVDGVPLQSRALCDIQSGNTQGFNIQEINPQNIESITIIKEANATALYGSRGINGVILITTKKGNYKKLKIDFESAFSTKVINKMPKRQDKYAQGRSINGELSFIEEDKFSYGPSVADISLHNGQNLKTYNPYDFFVNGYSFDNNLRISGNLPKANFSLFASNRNQKGIIPTATNRRNNVALKCILKPNEDFNATVNGWFITTNANQIHHGIGFSNIMAGVLLTPPNFDIGNGYSGSDAISNPLAYQNADGKPRNFSSANIENPYWSINHTISRKRTNNILLHSKLKYQFADRVAIQTQFSADGYRNDEIVAYDRYSVLFPLGQKSEIKERYLNLNSRTEISAYHDFANFRTSFITGFDYAKQSLDIKKFEGEDMNNISIYDNENYKHHSTNNQSFAREEIGIFGKAGLGYRELVFIEYVTRYNMLRKNGNKNFFNHSISGAWILSETFYFLPQFFNFAKIYASAGITGKRSDIYYNSMQFLSNLSNISLAIPYNMRRDILNQEELLPERNISYETGVNLKFANARISFDAAYFHTTTNNQIIPGQITSEYIKMQNAGTVVNKGVEMTLQIFPVHRSNVRWSVDFVLTKSKHKVTDLPDNIDRIPLSGFSSISSNAIQGQPFGVLFGTRYLRNNNGKKIIDENGYPIVDSEMGVIGNPNPDWTLGFNQSVHWKGLQLNLLIDIRKGGDIWNGTKKVMNYFGVSQESMDNRNIENYVFEGVNENGETNTIAVDFYNPANDISDNRYVRYGMAGVAENAIEDGSWIRAREISLSYQLPKKWSEKIKFQNITIKGFATNLFLITKYSGIDPEASFMNCSNGLGLDYFQLPQTKSYGISLKLSR